MTESAVYEHPRAPLALGEAGIEGWAKRRAGTAFRYRKFWNKTRGTLQEFIFSGCRHTRQRIRAALVEAHRTPAQLARFDGCAAQTWVWRHKESGRVTMRTGFCGNRWCPVCRQTYARRIGAMMFAGINHAEHRLAFVTLSQRQVPGERLTASMARLRTSFRRLRERPYWKKNVFGGVGVLETTVSKTYGRGTWHVHLHMILECKYLGWATVREEWRKAQRHAAGELDNVSIVGAGNARARGKYIVKYITKPYPQEIRAVPALLAEVMQATDKRGILVWLGTWRKGTQRAGKHGRMPGLRMRQEAGLGRVTHADEWEYLGTFAEVLQDAEAGRGTAQALLSDLGFGQVPVTLAARYGRAPPSGLVPEDSETLFAGMRGRSLAFRN